MNEYRMRELENGVTQLADELLKTNEKLLDCYNTITEMQKQINELAKAVYK